MTRPHDDAQKVGRTDSGSVVVTECVLHIQLLSHSVHIVSSSVAYHSWDRTGCPPNSSSSFPPTTLRKREGERGEWSNMLHVKEALAAAADSQTDTQTNQPRFAPVAGNKNSLGRRLTRRGVAHVSVSLHMYRSPSFWVGAIFEVRGGSRTSINQRDHQGRA